MSSRQWRHYIIRTSIQPSIPLSSMHPLTPMSRYADISVRSGAIAVYETWHEYSPQSWHCWKGLLVKSQSWRTYVYKYVNAIMAEAYISTWWCRSSLVCHMWPKWCQTCDCLISCMASPPFSWDQIVLLEFKSRKLQISFSQGSTAALCRWGMGKSISFVLHFFSIYAKYCRNRST